MPKEIATPKQEGGGGYTFEDNVSAFFLLKMISGRLPLGPQVGQIQSIQFQKRVDGWFLDDLVLFLRANDDSEHAVAISVKSNAQITSNGFPTDFVTAIWEQRLHVKTDKFDPVRDYLALATSSVAAGVKSSWDSLITKAVDAAPERFPERLASPGYANEIERAIFRSLHCPPCVNSDSTAVETARLLQRLRHLQYDYGGTPSEHESECVTRCGQLLRDGGQTGAASLWTTLKQIARNLATSGGDLTRSDLAGRLRRKFSLNEFPNYMADWQKIRRDFNLRIERVRDTLAGTLQLTRDEVALCSPEEKARVFVGTSGAGKTALAKHIAVSSTHLGHTIWLTAADLNTAGLSALLVGLGIRYRVPELVAESIGSGNIMIVDGLERLSETGVANLAALLRHGGHSSESPKWRFLFTCVADSWERTLNALNREYRSNVTIAVKTVAFRFEENREQLIKAFPNASSVLQRRDLEPLFTNLKILDVVLSHTAELTESTDWVGETDILDWFWSHYVDTGDSGAARSRVLQKLASLEADEFLAAVPVIDLESDECRLASEIAGEHLLWIREDQVGFQHDLVGDWARNRVLLSRRRDIVSVIKEKAINPCWYRAIRLHGLRLLERPEAGISVWRNLLDLLAPPSRGNIERDLILESLLFAANAEEQIQNAWPTLVAKDGNLLRRLLKRFLFVATLPDLNLIQHFDDSASRAYFRYPFRPLWPPMLRVLFENRQEAIAYGATDVTKIAELWLKWSGRKSELRESAATILIDAANHAISEIETKEWRADSEMCGVVFSRLLFASLAFPDHVAELASSLVERQPETQFRRATTGSEDDTDVEEDDALGAMFARGPIGDAWPEGPLRTVTDEVRDGFLYGSDAFCALFVMRPQVAQEVLLALLIREPLPTENPSFHFGIDEFLHLHDEMEWSPAKFFHGPFLPIVRASPGPAIKAIVALTNFATGRWKDNRDTPAPVIRVTVSDETVEFVGTDKVYYWYRDSVGAPNVVVPALMAVEKWLYEQIEEKRPIEDYLSLMLKTGRSTAILGVLVAVGRRSPALFKNELRELVPVWQLQALEQNSEHRFLESFHHATLIPSPAWEQSIIGKWNSLEHRAVPLGDVLFRLFLTDHEAQSMLIAIQKGWAEELRAMPAGSHAAGLLEVVSLRFDISKLRVKHDEDRVVVTVEEPEERTKRLEQTRQSQQDYLELVDFPARCRKQLDKHEPLADDAIEAFWQQLTTIAGKTDASRETGEPIEHSVAGGIAVLLILHTDWVKADGERVRWCSSRLDAMLNVPLTPVTLTTHAVTGQHWRNFAAMLLPRMLADAPTGTEIRMHCAQFALSDTFSVIQDFMDTAFEFRSHFPKDFPRLQRMMLLTSGFRNVFLTTQSGNSVWGCPDVEYDYRSLQANLIAQFVDSTLPPELPQIHDVAQNSNSKIHELVSQQREAEGRDDLSSDVLAALRSRIDRSRGFDPPHLKAGFNWLQKIDSVRSSTERESMIVLAKELLDEWLRPLGGVEEAIADCRVSNGHHFYRSPSRSDDWIFDTIATLILRLRESEHPRQLWEPILSMGLDRFHWVNYFLSSWFSVAHRSDANEDAFSREWKSMIEFAWLQKNWRTTSVRINKSKDELFEKLMGFSNFGYGHLEDVQFRSLMNRMQPDFGQWADEFLPQPWSTSLFALLLTFPSAADYRRDGMRRLADASAQFEDTHWNEFDHLEERLLKLLELEWNDNRSLIKSDPTVRRQFSTILKTMSDRQVSRALVLQDEMMRALGE